MGEKIYTFGDRHASMSLCSYQFAQRNQKYIYEVAHKKMECHNLQTFHWHYKAYVYTTDDATHCCSYFSVFFKLARYNDDISTITLTFAISLSLL